ncbi:SID1 transmembrane family member 1-like [Glandiceps talaboti]
MGIKWHTTHLAIFVYVFVISNVRATQQIHQVVRTDVNVVMTEYIEADFDTIYHGSVTQDKEDVYYYQAPNGTNQTAAVRVHVNSTNAEDDYPVLFVVRQQEGVTSWRVPIIVATYKYNAVARTLCPLDRGTNDLYIEYYYFNFTDEVDSVRVRATSGDNICAILSIQDTNCPVFDLIQTVEFKDIYQTMTKQAAITVKGEDTRFDKGQFYVVIVVYPDNSRCTNDEKSAPITNTSSYTERTKTVDIVVEAILSRNQYWKALLPVLLFFISFYIVFVIVAVVQKFRKSEASDVSDGSQRETDTNENEVTIVEGGSSPTLQHKTFLVDLTTKDRATLTKKYRLYSWNLLPIAILYSLPVIQLVLTHQNEFNKTGNQDICYFNFLCANPLGGLSAFNNVISNMGYVLLGILFLIIVWREDYLLSRKLNNKYFYEEGFGVPKHFGLFYAIGIALLMEGIFSGCYHVCPTYPNYQFDTSFMYTICGLLLLKMYQTRHPDILANAHVSYLCLAVVICIALLGMVTGTLLFWILFGVLYIFICCFLSFQIYFMWRIDSKYHKRVWSVMKREWWQHTKPKYTDRFVLIIIGNSINWLMAILGMIFRPEDFPSCLLAIFIINVLLYLTFYIVMKVVSERRKPRAIVIIYATLTLCFWGPALYFFTRFLAQFGKTPSESREGNRDCIFLNFFDHHDIWHFLSACGLFFSFMTLLTLDEDLDRTKRTEIQVF